jgi:hypothetical protein
VFCSADSTGRTFRERHPGESHGARRVKVDAEGVLLLSRFWPVAGAFVGVIVWLVRLEGAVKMNTKLRHELDEALEELKTEFKDHRREIWARTDYLRDLINGKN